MYGKHFSQMYTGSMYGAGPVVFAVWGYVISHTGKDGTIELNSAVLAHILGTGVEEIDKAIGVLTSPDQRSRSRDHDGRRLVQQGEYLYLVPTYQHYRGIKNDEERKEYNRLKQREHRAKKRDVKSPVNDSQHSSAHADATSPSSSEALGDIPPKPPVVERSRLPAIRKGQPRNYEQIRQHLSVVLSEVGEATQETLRKGEMVEILSELVFAYWAKKMNHEGALLDLKRLNRLKERLTENEANVHELLFVVDGARKDGNLMGQNERGRAYDGIETVFRDRGQVERLSRLAGYRPGRLHPTAEKFLGNGSS